MVFDFLKRGAEVALPEKKASATGRVVALSSRAMAALHPGQIETIERSARLLPLHIPTIELAGGSVRCMLAGIHLSARGPQAPLARRMAHGACGF